MSATGRIIADLGNYQYTVAPDLAIAETIQAIAVLKEAFEVGQQVKIIQIGEAEQTGAEYGVLSLAANLTPVVKVTDAVKPAAIEQSPATFTAAYIANAANKLFRYYDLGEVVQRFTDNSVDVLMKTGTGGGLRRNFSVLGLDAENFLVGEVALINNFDFGQPVIVGWWEMLLFLNIAVTLNTAYGFLNPAGGHVTITGGEYNDVFYPVTNTKTYAAGTSLTATVWLEPADHVFTSWSGSSTSTETTINFTITENMTLIPLFTRLPVTYYIQGNSYCTPATTKEQVETPHEEATFTAVPLITQELRAHIYYQDSETLADPGVDYKYIYYSQDYDYPDLSTYNDDTDWLPGGDRDWLVEHISDSTFLNAHLYNDSSDNPIQYYVLYETPEGRGILSGILGVGEQLAILFFSGGASEAYVYTRPMRAQCFNWYREQISAGFEVAGFNNFTQTLAAPESSNLNTQQQNTFYPNVVATLEPIPAAAESWL